MILELSENRKLSLLPYKSNPLHTGISHNNLRSEKNIFKHLFFRWWTYIWTVESVWSIDNDIFKEQDKMSHDLT